MTVSELVRYLKKQGVRFKEHGKRHDVYVNTTNGAEAQLPLHQSQEIKKGTAERIIKDLGLK